ncbi:MAG: shikimate kinase [Dethiobacteria bacterium]|jgi:shikimate kinase
MNIKNIILIGFMGTGKTKVGKLLAKRLGRKFYDSDKLIEEREGKKISLIFQEKGEAYFRWLETQVIAELSSIPEGTAVIATGGGVVLNETNLGYFRQHGVIIALMASPEEILQRVSADKNRPLLQVDDPLGEIKRLLAERSPLYAKADLSVDTDRITPPEVVDKIITLLGH